jgi:formamidopyrimidine-DNA glycosylase
VPELAEVETIRRDVDGLYVGRRIASASATGIRSVRRHPLEGEFAARITGRKVIAATRRGKYLLMPLDDGQAVVAHMGMSGQLLTADADAPLAKHTHVRISFDDGPDLRFVDPRTFGQMWVSSFDGESVPELSHLGFDPLDDPGAARKVADLVRDRPTRLKPLLMDQTRVVGIGNMYADEILFAARLRPDRPAASLSAAEAKQLHRAMVSVLTAAIKYRGSSLADEQYRDLFGRTGEYQKRHKVYAREGQPCPRCGAPIERVRGSGRSSFFCAECQF